MSQLTGREYTIIDRCASELAHGISIDFQDGATAAEDYAYAQFAKTRIARALTDALVELERTGQLEHHEFVIDAHDAEADEGYDRLVESQARS